jgi:hypothetical protein
MDLLLKTLAQAPLVALFAYLWWNNRKSLLKDKEFLEDRLVEKDKQYAEFIRAFDKLSVTLELIKDRLQR